MRLEGNINWRFGVISVNETMSDKFNPWKIGVLGASMEVWQCRMVSTLGFYRARTTETGQRNWNESITKHTRRYHNKTVTIHHIRNDMEMNGGVLSFGYGRCVWLLLWKFERENTLGIHCSTSNTINNLLWHHFEPIHNPRPQYTTNPSNNIKFISRSLLNLNLNTTLHRDTHDSLWKPVQTLRQRVDDMVFSKTEP